MVMLGRISFKLGQSLLSPNVRAILRTKARMLLTIRQLLSQYFKDSRIPLELPNLTGNIETAVCEVARERYFGQVAGCAWPD
jgi:hypothetical protein